MNQKIIDELIGWYGTCAIVVAYALVSFNVLSTSTLLYQILNGRVLLELCTFHLKRKHTN